MGTFTAILTRDGVRWIGDPPAPVAEGKEVVAEIHVREPLPLPGPGWDGRELVALMDRIADTGAFDDIEDPAAWVREQRGNE